MKHLALLLITLAFVSAAQAQDVKHDIPYAEPAHALQVLDVYSPVGEDLPVVFWIHGGGWQAGDKASVDLKPRVFVEKGFVFLSAKLPTAAGRGDGDNFSSKPFTSVSEGTRNSPIFHPFTSSRPYNPNPAPTFRG